MIFNTLVKDADMEWVMIDATIIRAHQHSSGAKGWKNQALRRSCRGFPSKIHAACDAYGKTLNKA